MVVIRGVGEGQTAVDFPDRTIVIVGRIGGIGVTVFAAERSAAKDDGTAAEGTVRLSKSPRMGMVAPTR